MAKRALYLAGGGARGAYQVGVLKAIASILKAKTLPFNMISGVSVGSLNAAVLADYADDFQAGTEALEAIWGEIHCQQIFNTSNSSLLGSIFRNASSFFIKQKDTGHLLDTAPLAKTISEFIDFEHIEANIAAGHIETLEIITNCYEAQNTISFYDNHNSTFESWEYPRHGSQQTKIQFEHVLASSALPLFFPAVEIDKYHYSDGSIGLITPLRGAIHFKMDKILILGTHHIASISQFPVALKKSDIGFTYVLGNMLNGLFLDNLDHDIDSVNRMNEIALLLSIWKKRYAKWRPITTKYLRPSKDVASIAQAQYKSLPFFLRFLLNMLGNQTQSGDLVSFLLFEKKFTRELIDLGYADTMANAIDIEDFFLK